MKKNLKIVIVAVITIFAIYISPFSWDIRFSLLLDFFAFQDDQGFSSALTNSVFFASMQSVILVFGSLALAECISFITLKHRYSAVVCILLVPILLGDVSTAFLWKIILRDTSFFFGDFLSVVSGLTLIQFWQFGTLFTYVFWLVFNAIPENETQYAEAIKLSKWEYFRDVKLPKVKNLLLFLQLLAFLFSFYENTKASFIFRTSRGTNTELIGQWLNRVYQSESLISASHGITYINNASLVVLAAAVVNILVISFATHSIIRIISRSGLYIRDYIGRFISALILILLLLSTAAPMIWAFLKQGVNVDLKLSQLSFTVGLTLIGAAAATVSTLGFTILCRITWQNILSSLNSRSTGFLVFLSSCLIIPPICIVNLGFEWMMIIGYEWKASIYFLWILNHIILSFPVLGGFALVTHFLTTNETINFLLTHRGTLREIVIDAFILVFKAEYVLTFLFGFAFIWNDGKINKVLSDIIPSFASETSKTIFGRAADYSSGMAYLFVSLAITFASISLWIQLHKRFRKTR